jgi:hypothetical protein
MNFPIKFGSNKPSGFSEEDRYVKVYRQWRMQNDDNNSNDHKAR